jgi:hypothetical protein
MHLYYLVAGILLSDLMSEQQSLIVHRKTFRRLIEWHKKSYWN